MFTGHCDSALWYGCVHNARFLDILDRMGGPVCTDVDHVCWSECLCVSVRELAQEPRVQEVVEKCSQEEPCATDASSAQCGRKGETHTVHVDR